MLAELLEIVKMNCDTAYRLIGLSASYHILRIHLVLETRLLQRSSTVPSYVQASR